MKQLKNVTGSKCALHLNVAAEGKEKTQEFKIPVRPEGVLCAVPLQSHAQYVVTGSVGVNRNPGEQSSPNLIPRTLPGSVIQLVSPRTVHISSSSSSSRASHICALLILRSEPREERRGRGGGRRSSPPDPTKVMVLPKGQYETLPRLSVAAKSRDLDLAV